MFNILNKLLICTFVSNMYSHIVLMFAEKETGSGSVFWSKNAFFFLQKKTSKTYVPL